MRSEAQKRADAKYERKAYDKVLLRLRKDKEPTRDTITQAAAARGQSLNAFIIEAIQNKIEQE